MSGTRTKYPIIAEAVFWHMVSKNEPYNGFVVHDNNIYSFVLPEITIESKQITKYMGEYTQYAFQPQYRYNVLKPIKTETDSLPLAKNVNPSPHYQGDRVNPNSSTIRSIFIYSEMRSPSYEWGKLTFEKNFIKYYKGHYDANAKVLGLSSKPGYVSDSETREKADLTNQWVNDTGVFYVDNYGDTNVADFTNFLLGCMIYGVGPENMIFPKDGTVSSSLKGAGIVKDALESFYKKNKGRKENLSSFSEEINGTTLGNNARSIVVNGFLHPETFLGSAHIKIEQNSSNSLTVTIFNITSLTSGDFFKHAWWNEYPMSIIRDQLSEELGEKNYYGNTSQTYSFTLPIDYSKLK